MSNQLIDSIWSQDFDSVRSALQAGADPNVVEEGQPVLAWACVLGLTEIAKELLQFGANPNAFDNSNESSLLKAAYAANPDLVKAMLAAGGDPNTADLDGQTPLMVAAKVGDLATVRLLLESGALPDAVDSRGRNALHWSMLEHDNADVVTLLASSGTSTEVRSADELTPMDYAERLARDSSLRVMQGLRGQ